MVQDNNVDFYASVSDEEINLNLIDDFQTIYQPLSLIKSDGKLFMPVGGWENVKSHSNMAPIKKNVAYMWKNRLNVQKELLKHNKKYDWIISTRVDLKYFKDLDYSLLDPDAINIPFGSEFNGYQDKIAIGKSEMINI
mgnify:CR=1 FL=1